ncbi:response regulator [Opitutus terrae]|uniref:histidine kinase n=1 Tax=Opitutus terrae (strain DSM 11246 / JCM 15787 / PB90-1) TaxID=452637 RepID=B2A072_OPITP|nr:response regulator [Opitutus terrae]ACB77408.1 multi-sensor hybrid histidine kinase [Opitutus terrae PB90-1]
MSSDSPLRNHRILVVDDNTSIHADFRKILGGGQPTDETIARAKTFFFGDDAPPSALAPFTIDVALQGSEGLQKVQQALAAGEPYALAFVDIRMPPGWDGVETIARLWQEQPGLQVVVCTAHSDYSWADMIRKLGVSDNLLVLKKPFDNIEVLQLAHALCEKWSLQQQLQMQLRALDAEVSNRTAELQATNTQLQREIDERRQVEQALLVSEERFSKAFEANPIPLALLSYPSRRLTAGNQGFATLTGYRPDEFVGRTIAELQLDADASGPDVWRQVEFNQPVRSRPARLRTKTGAVRDLLLSLEFLQVQNQRCLLVIAIDVTEQLELERQLRHSQKMEAIGELAAGIAHDFNNMLTVIQGNTSIVRERLERHSPHHELLETVASAAERSAKLVNQLLTFSRKQVLEVQPVEAGKLLGTLRDMLSRVIGEQITVRVLPPTASLAISADAGMIEQMLMNLAINARDAMPDGGTLTIGATAVNITPAHAASNPEARPGSFLCFSVADNGHGIAPEVLPRIFDPFFTTKPTGQGTGLGLATVYGIIKQHEGWIEVQSAIGQGTTFRVFLPLTTLPSVEPPRPAPVATAARCSETILVVEDEPGVRMFVTRLLGSRGYTVLAASDGIEALEHWARHGPSIDLLLTDVVMPGGITGHQLAATLLRQKPSLKVIFTSGYNPQTAGSSRPPSHSYLAKPYDASALLQALRAQLDQRSVP